jgi:hypothetical protein
MSSLLKQYGELGIDLKFNNISRHEEKRLQTRLSATVMNYKVILYSSDKFDNCNHSRYVIARGT